MSLVQLISCWKYCWKSTSSTDQFLNWKIGQKVIVEEPNDWLFICYCSADGPPFKQLLSLYLANGMAWILWRKSSSQCLPSSRRPLFSFNLTRDASFVDCPPERKLNEVMQRRERGWKGKNIPSMRAKHLSSWRIYFFVSWVWSPVRTLNCTTSTPVHNPLGSLFSYPCERKFNVTSTLRL